MTTLPSQVLLQTKFHCICLYIETKVSMFFEYSLKKELCVCVFLGNKLTTNSLDPFRKSLEMQSEGGLLRLCLEVCCV